MTTFSVRHLLVAMAIIVFGISILSYPWPDEIWFMETLASAIIDGEVDAVTVHPLAATANTYDDETALVLSGVRAPGQVEKKLAELGVVEDTLDSVQIQYVLINLSSAVLPVVALLLMGILSKLSRRANQVSI